MDDADQGLESRAKPVYYPIRRTDAVAGEKFRLHKIRDTLLEISPLEFFVWCDFESVRTDWLNLFLKIAGCTDPTAIGLTPFTSALACASLTNTQISMEQQNRIADFKAAEHSPLPPIHPALQAFDTLPDSAFIPLPVVCGLYGCSPSTAWRRVKSGHIASPHHIGSRTTRWNVGEVRQSLQGLSK